MGENKQTLLVFVSTLALGALGLTLVAQAQTENSPFAKKGQQAWETATSTTTAQQPYQYPYGSGTPAATTAPNSTGSYKPAGSLRAPAASAPITSTAASASSGGTAYPSTYNFTLPKTEQAPPGYSTGSSSAQSPSAGSYTPRSAQSSGGSPYPPTYSGGATPPSQTQTQIQSQVQPKPGASYDYPTYNRAPATRTAPAPSGGAYYPGRTNPSYTGQAQQSAQSAQGTQGAQGAYYPNNSRQAQAGAPNPYGTPNQPPRRSWKQQSGLDNLEFYYEGHVGVGAAGTYLGLTDDWREDFIADGSVVAELSAITPGGLEYGVAGELRGQYDQYRRGFGGRVGDCPAGIAGCSSFNVDGTDFALRGHTSRFYADGADDAQEFEAQLEGAHLFLRSAYGDVTLGRDDGAAYLFSLGAPSLLNIGASNSPVDYTGLDSVKTVNDASGFSEKVTYTSPRLLGDQIGVGIQIGASYALDAEACGVDFCVRGNDDEPAGVLAPELDDVFEVGLALDRKFENGLSVEATATYAIGSQQSNLTAFDDLAALGLGLELGYGDFTLGGSYLNSNNALSDGDYEAYDVGLTWQPSKLGFTVGYGHARDENIGLTSNQVVAGVSYDFNETFRLSTGVQYVDRDVIVFDPAGALLTEQAEDAASIFVEGRIKF